jgi:hypothetical protein
MRFVNSDVDWALEINDRVMFPPKLSKSTVYQSSD